MPNQQHAHHCCPTEVINDAVISDTQFEQAFEIPLERFCRDIVLEKPAQPFDGALLHLRLETFEILSGSR